LVTEFIGIFDIARGYTLQYTVKKALARGIKIINKNEPQIKLNLRANEGYTQKEACSTKK
jgi:hypothetical protein